VAFELLSRSLAHLTKRACGNRADEIH
jgi:hypothetical protein